jgi:hypothetical protein
LFHNERGREARAPFFLFLLRSRVEIIRVYDKAGNVIETHEHAGEFKEP